MLVIARCLAANQPPSLPIPIPPPMSSSSNDWLPLTGKHPVDAGSTLKKALQGGDSTAKSKFDRNYFAFRCMCHQRR